MSSNLLKNKQDNLKKTASLLSLCLALFLTFLKMFAALSTGSLAILSSFADSLSDVFASFVSLIAIKFSLRPPSCTHRYGYFKAESISALIQAAFIAGSGLFVLYRGFERFVRPSSVEHTTLGLLVMALSFVLTWALIVFEQYVVKKTNSVAINADRAHYVSDLLSNFSVVVSLVCVSYFNATWVDTLTAFVVSIYLLYFAFHIAKQAVVLLMDHELPVLIRQDVANIVQSVEGIKGFHDFRSRDLGGHYFFEIHLEMDSDMSLLKAHELSQKVEDKIAEKYPNAQIMTHQDPFGIQEKRLDDLFQHCEVEIN